jgi:hypothetical protein
VTLSDNNYNFISGDAATDVLTVGQHQTIQGAGHVGNGQLILNNQGTIIATGTNPLYIDPNSATNSGTIQANSGSLMYVGSFNQTAGAVRLNGGSINATSSFVVSGGSVQGAGTFLGGPVSIQSGGKIAPNGTLNFSGGLTLGQGSELDFKLGTVSDLINVSGGTLTGSSGEHDITIDIAASTGFGSGTYDLLKGNSFALFAADEFAIGSAPSGYTYNINFNSSLGELDLTATPSAVPEPSTYAAILGLASMVFVMARRRFVGSTRPV